MWLFAVILILPLIEIALFVTVGGWLGLWLTLLVVIGTGVAGVLVLRWQGVQAMQGLRQAAQQHRDMVEPMVDQALVAAAGMLLILPGFLTDTVGLLLLLSPIRRRVIRSARARMVVIRPQSPSDRRSGADILDGEYFEIEQDPSDPPSAGRPPSGWTRH